MLKSLRCPHCGDQAVTVKRKLEMGPRIWSACFSYGKPVTTRWWASILATIPGWGFVILAFQLDSWSYRIPIIIFGIVLSLAIQLFLVPLRFMTDRD
jgi:hypothetical protein